MTTHAPMKTMPEAGLRPEPVQPRSRMGAAWMTITLTALGMIGAIFTGWIAVEKFWTDSGFFDGTALWIVLLWLAGTLVLFGAAFLSSRRGRRI